MMKRTTMVWMAAAALALGLSACGDKPQEGAKAAKKSDAKAWDGSATAAYTAPGWKAGDRDSWEQQLKARNQSQNEYLRSSR